MISEDHLKIRRATSADAPAVADVWLRSFGVALPTVRRAHSDDEVRRWVRDVLLPTHDAWVAEVEDVIVGMIALSEGWIDQLYVDPDWRGHGVGSRLVELAKSQQPSGLQLWTFQINGSARKFYERHDFVGVEWTDGALNEEHEPDVRYVWAGRA